MRGFVFSFAFLLLAHCPFAAELPSGWRFEQQFTISQPGLIKFSLPIATLDAARPGLEDLRLYDSAGQEVPYLLQRTTVAAGTSSRADSFAVSLQENATVLSLETGVSEPINAVTLETPANNFVKAVQVEGSKNNRSWQTLADGSPIFRQPGGVEKLTIAVPRGSWPFLRLTIDDRRSAPIPFTGARIHGLGELAPTEPVGISIGERQETPGQTRLKLKLAAANLRLAHVRIETPEPLFTRRATVSASLITTDAIEERSLAQGVFYRVAVDGQPIVSNLTVSVEAQVPSREAFLVIQNQDSPALPITEVRAEHRPVFLTFMAREPGSYHLLTGNNQCAPPRYDLASLGAALKNARILSIQATSPDLNPSYRPAEALPGVQERGTMLDVSAWAFRKLVELADATAQQLELDSHVLAHAQVALADLRVIRAGRQVPYVVERTSMTRPLTPEVVGSNDPQKPKLSRWVIRLSHAGMPVTHLVCSSPTPLFARTVMLYENVIDDRGNTQRRMLSEALWTQTPDQATREFRLEINGRVQGDTLILEADNGDNPPIELSGFKAYYPVTRILFKASPGEQVFLYYGNGRAAPAHYDLALVAGQFHGTPMGVATLGAPEQLRKVPARGVGGKGGPIFWSILGLVVIVLLAIIAWLLPKQT